METVVGGLFNAVAFAGAGFLFSKLNHTGYERDKDIMKQWKNGMKSKWKEIEKLRQQLSDANADINQTNTALKTLAEINNHVKRLEQEYSEAAGNEPKLEDYYKPSDEMKDYQNVAFFWLEFQEA